LSKSWFPMVEASYCIMLINLNSISIIIRIRFPEKYHLHLTIRFHLPFLIFWINAPSGHRPFWFSGIIGGKGSIWLWTSLVVFFWHSEIQNYHGPKPNTAVVAAVFSMKSLLFIFFFEAYPFPLIFFLSQKVTKRFSLQSGL
jgi:hypothetical protein